MPTQTQELRVTLHQVATSDSDVVIQPSGFVTECKKRKRSTSRKKQSCYQYIKSTLFQGCFSYINWFNTDNIYIYLVQLNAKKRFFHFLCSHLYLNLKHSLKNPRELIPTQVNLRLLTVFNCWHFMNLNTQNSLFVTKVNLYLQRITYCHAVAMLWNFKFKSSFICGLFAKTLDGNAR